MTAKPQEFDKLIKNDRYQVFLMSCNCGLPISFARHHWFVINKKGSVERWEILIEKNCCGTTSWDYLHKDAKKPFEPLGSFTITGSSLWKPELVSMIEGDEGSLAQKMADFIQTSPDAYPFCSNYFITSPNSNTYVKWVLDKFPEFPGKMPWNAFGRGYKFKSTIAQTATSR